MRDKSSIRPLQFTPRRIPASHRPPAPKINRNIGSIEFPVSLRKQRPNKKSIATFPAHLALQESFTRPHATNPTPSQINRHTSLLEFAVSHRKQSSIKILIETKTTVFPRAKSVFRHPNPDPPPPPFSPFPPLPPPLPLPPSPPLPPISLPFALLSPPENPHAESSH